MGVFIYVYAEIRSRAQIREKRWKKQKIDVKEMIAAVYFKIHKFSNIKDLPIGTTQYIEASTKI